MPETESSTEHVHEWSPCEVRLDIALLVRCQCGAENNWPLQWVARRYQAHDALVAALEAVMNGASEFGADYSAGMPRSLWLAMEQGEDALRLAKGEAS